jgi:Domain of unknown function (DUF1735)
MHVSGGINNQLKFTTMKDNKYKIFMTAIVAILLVTSCKKTDTVTSLTNEGKTIIKILGGGLADHTVAQTLTGIDFINQSQTISLAEIRRDPHNNAALNTILKISLHLDTILLKRLNDTLVKRGQNPLQKMPSSWYTLNTGGTLGSTINLEFAAGEISKIITVTIPNAGLFDPGSTYAFPLRIVSFSNTENVVSINNSIIAKVAAKNQYDGIYELNFSNYHPTANSTYSGGKATVHLITTALNKVKIYWPDAGGFANPALLNGTLSFFGSQEPEYTINNPSNTVTVQNAFAGASTFYTMNPGFNSYYDPAAKKIYTKWGYSYVAGTFATGVSREWTQEFKYIGPR